MWEDPGSHRPDGCYSNLAGWTKTDEMRFLPRWGVDVTQEHWRYALDTDSVMKWLGGAILNGMWSQALDVSP